MAFNELQIWIILPIHHLRHTNRKAQESQKEMKLLLDMYKSAPKEQRDKVQLMAAEKKSKAEVHVPLSHAVFLWGKTINMQFTTGGPSLNANINNVW